MFVGPLFMPQKILGGEQIATFPFTDCTASGTVAKVMVASA